MTFFLKNYLLYYLFIYLTLPVKLTERHNSLRKLLWPPFYPSTMIHNRRQTTTPGTTCPTLSDKFVGSFTSRHRIMNIEGLWDGANGLIQYSRIVYQNWLSQGKVACKLAFTLNCFIIGWWRGITSRSGVHNSIIPARKFSLCRYSSKREVIIPLKKMYLFRTFRPTKWLHYSSSPPIHHRTSLF